MWTWDPVCSGVWRGTPVWSSCSPLWGSGGDPPAHEDSRGAGQRKAGVLPMVQLPSLRSPCAGPTCAPGIVLCRGGRVAVGRGQRHGEKS